MSTRLSKVLNNPSGLSFRTTTLSFPATIPPFPATILSFPATVVSFRAKRGISLCLRGVERSNFANLPLDFRLEGQSEIPRFARNDRIPTAAGKMPALQKSLKTIPCSFQNRMEQC